MYPSKQQQESSSLRVVSSINPISIIFGIIVLLSLSCLPGCAPAPTPVPPTSVPVPSSTPPLPTRTPFVITPTPVVTQTPIPESKSSLTFNYPLTLTVDSPDVVTVEIIPERFLAFAGQGTVSTGILKVESGSSQSRRNAATYTIPIYRVMSAELTSAPQDYLTTTAGKDTRQTIDPNQNAFWTWNIVANKGPRAQITLRISGEIEASPEAPPRVIVNDTRNIDILDKSIIEKLGDLISTKPELFFSTGGVFTLLVAILTFVLTQRRQRKEDKFKEAEEKLKEAERKRKEAEDLARRLED
jgi:hypothetical protein